MRHEGPVYVHVWQPEGHVVLPVEAYAVAGGPCLRQWPVGGDLWPRVLLDLGERPGIMVCDEGKTPKPSSSFPMCCPHPPAVRPAVVL